MQERDVSHWTKEEKANEEPFKLSSSEVSAVTSCGRPPPPPIVQLTNTPMTAVLSGRRDLTGPLPGPFVGSL